MELNTSELLEELLFNLPVGIMLLDGCGRVVRFNAAMEAILGEGREAFQARLRRGMEGGGTDGLLEPLCQMAGRVHPERSFSLRYDRGNGRTISLVVTGASLSGAAGRLTAIVVEDVSLPHEYYETDRAIFKSMHALQSERTEALVTLAQSVAHQILNPVMVIGGFARRLQDHPAMDEKGRAHLAAIFDESSRLEAMVRALSSYASIRPSRREALTVEELARFIDVTLAGKAATVGKKAQMECLIAGDGGVVWSERGLLLSAFGDLLQNAVDFSDKESVALRVDIACPDGSWRIGLADDGPGIQPEHLPFVFDPFFSTKARGVGIGLSRARRILVEHRGEIRLVSRPGEGTRVMMTIPQRAPRVSDHVGRRSR